jgi:hypothetical protein
MKKTQLMKYLITLLFAFYLNIISAIPAMAVWTPRWENLGGTSLSGPAVASSGVGRIEVFWRGTDNHLKYKSKLPNGGWSREQDLGGSLSGDPAAVAQANGRIDVFWRGVDGSLRRIWYLPDGGWSAEQNLGAQLRLSPMSAGSGPAVALLSSGRLDVFWRATDNRLRHIWSLSNAGWSAEQNLGGALASDPAAVSSDNNRIDLFWKDSSARLKHIWYPYGNGWSAEEDLAGGLDSSPSATSWGQGRMDVFWKGTDNKLKHRWTTQGSWMPAGGGIEDLGGNLTTAPEAASGGPGDIHVIARGGYFQALEHKAWQISPWHNDKPYAPSTMISQESVWDDSRLFEFSSVVAPPGTFGCSAGRYFLSGSNSSGVGSITNLLLQRDICPFITCPTTNTFPSVPQGQAYYIGNDNVMARLSNGTLLLVRLIRTNTHPSNPAVAGPAYDRVGALVWASTDCGNTWTIRNFIDSANTANFAPPDWDGVDSGYAEQQPKEGGGTQRGGWDRPEIYADHWSGNVYITMAARGGVDASGNAKYSDTLLFRSSDGGESWAMRPVISGTHAPLMMTSVGGLGHPSALFLFRCTGSGYPYLYRSYDGGVTLSEPFKVSNYQNGSVAYGGGGLQGCQSVTRIGRYIDTEFISGDTLVDTVRVTWSSVVGNRQVLQVASVKMKVDIGIFPSLFPPPSEATHLKTIERLDGDIVRSTIIETEPSLVGFDSGENTALLFWIERIPDAFSYTNRLRGIVVRDENGWSDPFYISQYPWIENGSTGHYIKGGFYVNPASTLPLRFWVPWIEEGTTKRYLHTKQLGVIR